MASVVNAQIDTPVSGSDPTSARPELLESLGIDGLIDVEADGSVSQVTFKNSNLKREIEQRLQDRLLAWRFHPIEVDGQVRNIRSSFRLRLELLRDSDRTWLQVAKYEFGVPVQLDAQPPRYPTSAMRDRMGAEVLMWVAVRADGSVAEVEPVRGQAFGKRISGFWQTDQQRKRPSEGAQAICSIRHRRNPRLAFRLLCATAQWRIDALAGASQVFAVAIKTNRPGSTNARVV